MKNNKVLKWLVSYDKKAFYLFMLNLLFYLTFGVQNSESTEFQRGERCYTSKPERSSVAT